MYIFIYFIFTCIYLYTLYLHKYMHPIFLKYIHACVCIYIYIINIHSAHTYIMKSKTCVLDAINRD